MPRPRRADAADGLYHALNRGHGRLQIFWTDDDYSAVERILAEGLQEYDASVDSFQLMPNRWHLILRPSVDGEMSRFLRWVPKPAKPAHRVELIRLPQKSTDLSAVHLHKPGRF